MEQRHITGKSHWYHETQSSTAEYDVLPLVPEAAKVSDPFLLDVILDEETLAPFLSWLVPARVLAVELFQPMIAFPGGIRPGERRKSRRIVVT